MSNLLTRIDNKLNCLFQFHNIVRTSELLAILAAIIALIVALNDRHEERIARAWQLLTTTAPGNSGKIEALEYLNSQYFPNWLLWLPFTKEQISLEGIELIPPDLAELWRGKPKLKRELPNESCWKITYMQKVEVEDANCVVQWYCPQTTYLQSVRLVYANLSRATLACSNLVESNLRKSDLTEADLRRANFDRANLQEANLWLANLRRANLFKANLWRAELIGADLRGTDLEMADLRKASLEMADLQGASLEGADLRATEGIDCSQLTQAKNWEKAYRDEKLACGKAIPIPAEGAEEYPAVVF